MDASKVLEVSDEEGMAHPLNLGLRELTRSIWLDGMRRFVICFSLGKDRRHVIPGAHVFRKALIHLRVGGI